MRIRLASINDFEALCAIDSCAATCAERSGQIRRWLETACCWVYEINAQISAYGVLTQHFFGQPFIEMVMVGQKFRRQGMGAAIISHFQATASGAKLFSSTNMSNRTMQQLLTRQGFKPSGYIDNLDEGDPEIIFYCPLTRR